MFCNALFLEDSPVGSGPLGYPKQGGGHAGEGSLIGPIRGVFHTVDKVTPVKDGEGILVLFGMKERNFSLVDLHNRILGGGGHGSDCGSSS